MEGDAAVGCKTSQREEKGGPGRAGEEWNSYSLLTNDGLDNVIDRFSFVSGPPLYLSLPHLVHALSLAPFLCTPSCPLPCSIYSVPLLSCSFSRPGLPCQRLLSFVYTVSLCCPVHSLGRVFHATIKYPFYLLCLLHSLGQVFHAITP